LATYTTAGVTGLTLSNGTPNAVLLSAVNSALASTPLDNTDVGTTAAVQAVVNAYAFVLAHANSALDNDTANDPTAATYQTLGVSLGGIALNPDALALLNVVIGQSSASQVDSVAKIEAVALAVNAVLNTSDSANPQATAAHFATLGITGVHADNLTFVLASLQATADEGTGARTQAQLQALVDSVNARLLGVISQYAQANSGTPPTVLDFARAGITGVNSINIFGVNSALASAAVTDASVDTLVKAQTVVDSFLSILAEANGLAPDATPAQDPTAQDYMNIGATRAAGLNMAGLALLNEVIRDLPFQAVDSISEIEALANTVSKIIALANGTAPSSNLTLQDMQALGITGVTTGVDTGQLQNFIVLLKSSGDTATPADSLAELRALLQTAAEQNALNVITQYAQTNTGTLPSLADFSFAGVTGVNSQNLAAVQSALASASVTDAQADTSAEVQDIVNAYNLILAEANGALTDQTPGQNPTTETYKALGATTAANLTAQGLQLLNSGIGNLSTDKVNTIAKIEVLAAAAQRVMAAAAGNTQALSLADLQALGLNTSGMGTNELDALKANIAATVDNGSAVAQASELQALIYAVMNRMPSVSGLQLSSDTGMLANDFITSQALQTLNASLSAPLGSSDRLFGRLDGVVSAAGNTGWLDLTGMVQGTALYWANAQLETGAGKTIQLQIVRNGSLFGDRLEQSYELITSPPAAPTEPPVLIGPNPSPSGMISLTVAPPPGAARVALMVDGRVIPSLYHAATHTIMAIASLPEGNWNVQYRYEDRAGNISLASPSAAIRIVSPQNELDLQELDGDGILFTDEKVFRDLNNDGIDDADQRDVVSLQMTNGQNIAIDTTVQSPNFNHLLENPSFNQGRYLKVEIQIDGIHNRAATTSELLSASLGGTQTVTNVTDVLEFRFYPQVIRTGLVNESQVDLLAAQVINQYVGQIHRIDLRLPEGQYNTYFKVSAATQTVWDFKWDAVSKTGAVFNRNSNGLTDTVSLFIRDGGRGDDDGVADGVIVDPGFVALVKAVLSAEPAPLPVTEQMNVHMVRPAETFAPIAKQPTMDFSAFGFDARSLDQPDPLWTSLKGELPKTAQPVLRADTQWLDNLKAKGAWDNSASNTRNWMNAGQDRDLVQPKVDWFAADAPKTRAGGFPVMVMGLDNERIAVLRGQPDHQVPANEKSLIRIATDVFAHTSADAEIRLTLTRANGQALPKWLSFDGETGELFLDPPADAPQELELMLTAIDQDGENATTVFRIQVIQADPAPQGRMSFSDKLRNASGVTLTSSAPLIGSLLGHA
jgi:hypothetical protein